MPQSRIFYIHHADLSILLVPLAKILEFWVAQKNSRILSCSVQQARWACNIGGSRMIKGLTTSSHYLLGNRQNQIPSPRKWGKHCIFHAVNLFRFLCRCLTFYTYQRLSALTFIFRAVMSWNIVDVKMCSNMTSEPWVLKGTPWNKCYFFNVIPFWMKIFLKIPTDSDPCGRCQF